MPARSFIAKIVQDDSTTMTGIEVPFDPKAVFGKVRAPVRVTINDFTYRSTICAMEGRVWIPVRKSNREAAGVQAGDKAKVTLAFDDQPRTVTAPKDLTRALRDAKLLQAFQSLAYTHQREHVEAVEQAKRPETRERRIRACVEMVASKSKSRSKAARSSPK